MFWLIPRQSGPTDGFRDRFAPFAGAFLGAFGGICAEDGPDDTRNSSSASTPLGHQILATPGKMRSRGDRNAVHLLRWFSANHGQRCRESDRSQWRGRTWGRHQGHESVNQFLARGHYRHLRRIFDFLAAGGPLHHHCAETRIRAIHPLGCRRQRKRKPSRRRAPQFGKGAGIHFRQYQCGRS